MADFKPFNDDGSPDYQAIANETIAIQRGDPDAQARQKAYDDSFVAAQQAGTVPRYPIMDRGGWDPYMTKLSELANPGGELQLPGIDPVDGTVTLPAVN